MPPRDNRLAQLRKRAIRQPRTHMLWVHHGDTPADTQAKRDRLIAEGRAQPDDTFVHIRWKRPDET
jgi:hypothetical protein